MLQAHASKEHMWAEHALAATAGNRLPNKELESWALIYKSNTGQDSCSSTAPPDTGPGQQKDLFPSPRKESDCRYQREGEESREQLAGHPLAWTKHTSAQQKEIHPQVFNLVHVQASRARDSAPSTPTEPVGRGVQSWVGRGKTPQTDTRMHALGLCGNND